MQNTKGVNAMANFNEHALEMSIMELFKDEDYTENSDFPYSV